MSYNLPLIEQAENITDKNVAPAMAKEQPALQSLIAPELKKTAPVSVKSESLLSKASKWISGLFKIEKKVIPKKTTHTRNQNTNQHRNTRPDRSKRNSKNHERKEHSEQPGNRNERADRNDKNERSERKPRNDNRKPRREDKPVEATQNAVMVTKSSAPAPAKKKEQVAERRKRRDTRRSVRVDADNDESNNAVSATVETQADVNKQPDTVLQHGTVEVSIATDEQQTLEKTPVVESISEPTTETEASITDASQAVSEKNTDEESATRTRSRRSPRHVRAAGQKRSKAVDESDGPLTNKTDEVSQDELQFDEPVAAHKVEITPELVPEVVVPKETQEQTVLELTTDSVQNVVTPEPAPAANSNSQEEGQVAVPVTEKEDVSKPVIAAVKKSPIKKTTKKVSSLKIAAKPLKKVSVSAPMARPTSIDEVFVDVKIGSLEDAARPEVKRSGKSAALSSSSNAATAPATRPGSQIE
jgi:ribonuclease E